MRKLKVTEMGRMSVEEYHAAEKTPLVVVLDHVRSLYNVGSIFRTADAFRLAGVCLCGITAVPPHPEIHKTALGAEDSVDWKYFKDTLDAVKWLKDSGYEVLAVEQCEGSTILNDFNVEPGKRYAIILGNEVKGVQQSVVDECEGCLEIPQYGTKHSMNVSVTAGIVIWELVKKMM
ncbi:MAG: RNA methyltransferase [Bacteroidaceae bacterium]|nr:RNA methyltransferase [Bacteroidaceae bacterium]